MNRLQRSSLNLLSGAAGYVVPMLINIVTTPILLAKLGEAAYGVQSLVAVIVGYLTLMDLGLDLPITKYLAEDKARGDTPAASKLLNTTLQTYVVIGVLGMLIIFASADLLATRFFKVPADLVGEAKIVFRIAGIGFLGSIGTSWGRAVAMGVQRLDISYGVSVVASILGAVVGLAAIFKGYGVVGYVTVRVVLTLLTGPACVLLLRNAMPPMHFQLGLHRKTLKRIATFVEYGTANRAMGAIFGRLDQTLIGVWIGVSSAGIYAIPVMMTTSIVYMIAYMFGYVLPTASELSKTGETARLKDICVRSIRFLCGLVSMTFIPLFCFGGTVLHLWVGKHVAEQTTEVLGLLTIAGYVTTLFTAVTTGMIIGMGYIRYFFFYSLLRNVVLASLYAVLIKPYGLNGAGVSMIVASGIDVVFCLLFLRKYLRMNLVFLFKNAFIVPIILGLALGLGAFHLRPFVHSWATVIATCALFEILYFVLGFAVGVFGDTEKRALLGIHELVFRQAKKEPDFNES